MDATHPHGLRPLVVARRWDQLGGRLSAIVNGMSLAELFGLDFRFVWPEGPDPIDPRQLFTQAFLDSFRIEPERLDDRTVIWDWELATYSTADAARRLDQAGPRSYVEIDGIFGVFQCVSETSETAHARFRRCWNEISWCDEVRRMIDSCSGWPTDGPIGAVHVRAGDIVEGPWRQSIVHEKYLPTPFIDYAIDTLAGAGQRRVLVLSDNTEYLAWLLERFPTIVTTASLPGYAELADVQQALADIVILSQCDQIIGPPSSAFSLLAARLGPELVVRADETVPAGQEIDVLLAGIDKRAEEIARFPFFKRLLARDICWCLDVFGEALPLRHQYELARQATDLDPEFSGAAARFARVAALFGDVANAGSAAARAVMIAESSDRSADPLFEALSTDIVVKCVTAIRARPPGLGRFRFPTLKRTTERWDREDRQRIDGAASEMRRCFSRALELVPIWSDRERVLDGLSSLLSIMDRLSEERSGFRRQVARALAATGAGGGVSAPRLGGLEDHRAVAMYDPLNRDLTRIVSCLNLAVQEAGSATKVAA